ncbi:3'(2'),5'-bisphosphate nucleotidase CysQ [Jiella sp. MQZ13P-4]|uniref:3'(2'),5'-bisphosphate nucleotidase CysQ n=2 Tax=Jiella sonneratiae TaxID=2816856 RepID=A0ABS3J458_9HYPH|nr:3'(2'),5'-bisphosphate nucleotidase CysQ [Jiella sonneratiae]
MTYFQRDPQVWYKNGTSPVSEADYAVDRALEEALSTARPGYGWVSEEMQDGDRAGTERHRVFVVDPIDGTRAFLRGEDVWCVSIAVLEAGVPVAGVLHVPVRGETFEATADGPALINGAPCRVSEAPAGRQMRLSVPDSMRKRLRAREGEAVEALPVVPSLAYRLALVASGRLDGTLVRPRANDWDVAAADLILERAGGFFADAEGGRWRYGDAATSHGVMVAGPLGLAPRLRDIARGIAA